MTVRWMIPNSSSRAGVAGDDILRGREHRKATGKGGKMIGSGLAMLSSPRCTGPRGRRVLGSGAQGRGLGGRMSPGCVSTARAPGVQELAQESRWKGRVPGLGNRHTEGRA